MNSYVTEDDINESKILSEIGEDAYGDEDFDLFKCPNCKKIYFMDYEIETLYYNPFDLRENIGCNGLICLDCGYNFEGKLIMGKNAECLFKVTKKELINSGWRRFLITQ